MGSQIIDSLEVEVVSQAGKAINALDSLCKKLGAVKSSVGEVNLGGIGVGKLQNDIASLSNGIKELKSSLNGVKGKRITVDTTQAKTAIADVTKSVDSIGQNSRIAWSFGDIQNAIRNTENEIDNFKTRMANLAESNASTKEVEQGIASMASQLADAEQRLKELNDELVAKKEAINWRGILDSQGLEAEENKILDIFNKTKNSQGKFFQDGMQVSADVPKQYLASWDELISRMQSRLDDLAYIKTSLAEGSTEFKIFSAEEIQSQIDILQNKLTRLMELRNELMGMFVNVKDDKGAGTIKFGEISEIKETKEAIRDTDAIIQQLQTDASKMIKPEINTTNLQTLKNNYEQVAQRANDLRAQLINYLNVPENNTTSKHFQKLATDFMTTSSRAEALRIKIEELSDSEEEGDEATVSWSSRLRMAQGAVNRVASSLSKAIEGVRTFADGMRRTVEYVRDLNTHVRSVIPGLKKKDKSLKKTLKSVLRYGFGIRSLFVLFNRMRTAIKEGYQNLRAYSSSVNQSLSMMSNSLLYLKNAFASGFEPIVSVVAPLIRTFINLIASALNALGRFLSVLTGKGFAYQALEDVNAGVKGIGSSASGASGDVKDLKKQLSLLSFDELNQLSEAKDNASSGGGGGGGTGATSAKDMFTTVETDTNEYIQLWAQNIRDAFKAEDWTGLGEAIADGLNVGINKIYDVISWDRIGPKITSFTDAFTESFNGLVSRINWDQLGRTIGGGLQTLIFTIKNFIEGIDWRNLGTKLATGLNGIFDEVDWAGIGHFIGEKFMLLWEILYGFVSNIDWGALGQSIASAINGVFEKINFSDIATVLVRAINGLANAILSFVANFDWGAFAQNIFNGINTMIHNVDWVRAGKSFGAFLKNVFDTMWEVVKNVDWKGLGKGIGDFISQIDWLGIIKNIISSIGKILSGLISGLSKSVGGWVVLGITSILILAKTHLISKIGGLFDTLGLVIASKGQAMLGIPFLSNPFVGIIAAGTALVASTMAWANSISGVVSDVAKKASEKTDVVIQSLKDLSNAYDDIYNSREKLIANVDKEYAYIDSLKNELDTLVDANGTVKEGYEDRVAYILNELSSATGVEAELINGVVQGYDEYRKSIDSVVASMINETRMQAVLSDYQKILEQNLEAQTKINEARAQIRDNNALIEGYEAEKQRLKELQAQYDINSEEYKNYALQMSNVQASINELTNANSEALGAINDTADVVGEATRKMEEDMRYLTEASTDNAERQQYAWTLWTQGITNVADMTESELAKMLSDEIAYLANMKEAIANGTAQYSEVEIKAQEERIKALEYYHSEAVNKAKEDTKDVTQAIVDAEKKGETKIENASKSMGEAYADGFAEGVEGGISDGVGATEEYKAKVIDAMSGLGADMTRIGQNATSSFGNSLNTNQSIVTTAMNRLKALLTGTLKNVPAEMGKTGSSAISDLTKALGETSSVSEKMSLIARIIQAKIDATAVGSGAITSLASGLNNTNPVQEGINKVGEFLTGTGMGNKAKGWGTTLAQNIGNGINSVDLAKYIRSVQVSMTQWLGGTASTSKVADLNFKALAKGGLITDAMISLIGEAGNEAVLPLTNKRSMSMIADSIMDNYKGAPANNDALASKIISGVADIMMNVQSKPVEVFNNVVVKTENDEVLARAVDRGYRNMSYRYSPVG